MSGVQFNSDDEPVFNSFDLPTICTGADDAERACCDPCEEWLHCLRRTPIEMHLPGFDLSRWLPCVSFSASKVLSAGGTMNGDDTNVFAGTFLALATSEHLTNGNCGVRGVTGRCTDAFIDDGYYEPDQVVTHTTSLPRTVYAPNGHISQVKNFYVDLNVTCVLNEEEQPCLKFTVVLFFEYERVYSAHAFDTYDTLGVSACDPAIVSTIDALEDGWVDGVRPVLTHGCCPLMESALIPLAGLVWADLDDIPLTFIDQTNAWELEDEMDPDGPWTTPDSPNVNGCDGRLYGQFKTVTWAVSNLADAAEEAECGYVGPSPVTGEHEVNEGCEHPAEGDATVWARLGVLAGDLNGIWIPPPITVNEGDAFLKVLATGCKPPEGCGSCVPDPEKPHVAVPVEFSFTATGTSCNKTFTPEITECVNVLRVYWPWGEVSDGLDSVNHTIVNLDEGALDLEETITAIAIDDRGCIYCYTGVVGCGCCEGVSGSLSVTVGPDGCGVEVTATTSEGCDEDIPVIEVIFYSGTAPAGEDCHCDPELEESEFCLGGREYLADGQTTTRTGVFLGLRWRLWDKVCGCAGPWTEYPGEITCPTVTVYESHETLDPNVEYSEDCGWSELVRFTWTAEWPAWFCGERLTLAWKHTGYSEGCAEGTILNPGDPEEDQIAQHIFTEDVLQKRYAHTIKFWLIGPGFICEGPCFPFPECVALNPDFDSGEACEAVGLPVCATA